ncbi:hypothetical protein CEXT_759251 [Caerostris extrusa]|uniref:Uncharacterized protein n=1 Tax=Caerostris extrusa TaxID=172846 RepID=A0AAV4P242_CAEEX|nr:hypothetical protein CEXT_759251 [Caerostris extrusa]
MNTKSICGSISSILILPPRNPSPTLISNQPHARFICHVPPTYISFRCRLMSFFPPFLCLFLPIFSSRPTDAREIRNGYTRCDVTTTGCQGLFDSEIQIQSIS